MTVGFSAMDTQVSVLVPGVSPLQERALAAQVGEVFADAERIFSRFCPKSELSRLNRGHGPVVASAALFSALQRARAYWEMTDGWFDPTIGGALCAAGYDRSFSAGPLDRDSVAAAPPRPVGFGQVQLDPATRSVLLPAGVAVDCGGFVKGWTVDCASELLPSPAALNAGGDAVLRGAGPAGEGWLVDIEDPQRATSLMVVEVRDGAVATSGTNRRTWWVGRYTAHHLIDPRSGHPANSDLAQVTVIAGSAEYADVLAKTALLRGSRAGRRFLDGYEGISAVLVGTNGRVQITGEPIARRAARDIFSRRS